jgi:hypothetical protein
MGNRIKKTGAPEGAGSIGDKRNQELFILHPEVTGLLRQAKAPEALLSETDAGRQETGYVWLKGRNTECWEGTRGPVKAKGLSFPPYRLQEISHLRERHDLLSLIRGQSAGQELRDASLLTEEGQNAVVGIDQSGGGVYNMLEETLCVSLLGELAAQPVERFQPIAELPSQPV